MELRKLKEDTMVEDSEELAIPKSKLVKTRDGHLAEVDPDGFDFKLLDKFIPYNEDDPLPAPVIKTNKKGNRYLAKPSDSRFFFQGNEMIQIYRGLSGKKTRLFWLYKDKDKNGQPNALHQRIRKYLRKRGIPGA